MRQLDIAAFYRCSLISLRVSLISLRVSLISLRVSLISLRVSLRSLRVSLILHHISWISVQLDIAAYRLCSNVQALERNAADASRGYREDVR
jgi:hypothetical protein